MSCRNNSAGGAGSAIQCQDDEGFGYEAPEEAVRIDEDAEAADLVAMGAELAKLMEEEADGSSDELKAALADFESPDDEDNPAAAESV